MIRARAKALNGAGWIAVFQGDYERAEVLLEEGLALYRGLGDKNGTASCLAPIGFAAMLGQRNLASVPALLEEAMRLRPELEDARTIANLLIFAGLVAASEGDTGRAIALLEEGLTLYREVRDTLGISMCLTVMGLIETARSNNARAARLIQENLSLACGSDDKVSIHYSLVGLASVALGLGDQVRAAQLWGAAEAMRESFAIDLTPMARALIKYEDLLEDTRAGLDEATFTRAWAAGRAMAQDRAVEYALSEEEPASAESPAPTSVLVEPPAFLTRREEEVASLVARGLTNRRIAKDLSISERTVDTHVGRILGKLGARSRDEVAGHTVEQPPQGAPSGAVKGR